MFSDIGGGGGGGGGDNSKLAEYKYTIALLYCRKNILELIELSSINEVISV